MLNSIGKYIVTENVVENTDNVKLQITERQKIILEMLNSTGKYNVVENVVENSASLSKKIGVSERTIQRELAILQEKRIILHIGPDKGGRWQVLKTPK